MPTIITTSVGTSGRDYSTLQSAHDAMPASLVTADQSWVFNLYNDSEFSANPPLYINGKATDATHTQTWQPASGQGFYDNVGKLSNALFYNAANGVAIRATGTAGPPIENNTPYVTIDGLQLKDANGNNGYFQDDNSATSVLSRCIIESNNLCVFSTNTQLVNVLGVATGTTSSDGFRATGINATLTNCTAVNVNGTGRYGFRTTNSLVPISNCASFGFTTACVTSNTGSGSDYNATSDATAPGSHSLKSKTTGNQFVNSASDFRVKAGADLIAAGSVNALAGGLDILKQTRSATAPTIGAFEYITSGAAALVARHRIITRQSVNRANTY